jgi:hypothetical protein
VFLAERKEPVKGKTNFSETSLKYLNAHFHDDRCLVGKLQCVFGVRKTPGPRKQTDGDQATFSDDDVVASLLQAQDEEENESYSASLQHMHARAMDSMFPLQSGSSDSPSSIGTMGASSTASRKPRDERPPPKLNAQQAKGFIDEYIRTRISQFPFVLLAPNGPSLKKRPFLSLAILCVMTSEKPRLSQHLEREFRRVLGDAAISGTRTSPRKTLDLLQGLLVYLAFYPIHIEPKSGRVHRLVKMAADIIDELQSEDFGDVDESLEYMRTFIGCYVVSST